MNGRNDNTINTLKKLFFEYKAMSQKGTVPFFEETVFVDLAKFGISDGDEQFTEQILTDAKLAHPFSTSIYLMEAEFRILRNELSLALSAVQKAESLTGTPGTVVFKKAEILTLEGQHDAALALIKASKHQAFPRADKVSLCELEMKILEELRQMSSLYSVYQEYALLNVNQADTTLQKIWFATEVLCCYDESIEFHNHFLNQNAYSTQAWFNLGNSYFALDQTNQAIEAYRNALAIDPGHEASVIELVAIYENNRLLMETLEIIEDALELHPNSISLLNLAARQAIKVNKLAESYKYVQRSNRIASVQPETAAILGQLYQLKGKLDLATKNYYIALELDSTNSNYWVGIGECMLQAKDYRQAQEAFEEAIGLAPDEVNHWLILISFCIETGMHDQAAEYIEEAALYLNSTEILYCKAALLLTQGKEKEGVEWFIQGLTEDFCSHENLFIMNPSLIHHPLIKDLILQYESR